MPLQTIDSEGIKDGGIQSVDIADLAITASKIAAAAVGTTAIQAAAITAPLLAVDSVSTASIQANAVATSRIGDLQVTTLKLADASVTTAKLAPLSVTTGTIAASAVTFGKIGPAAVDAAAMAANSVGATAIQTDAVTTVKIQDRAVTNIKIALNSIDNSLLSAGELHFAADTTSLQNKKAVFNLELNGVTLQAGPSADLSSQLSAETPVTSVGSAEGVITDTPKNVCTLRDQNTQPIVDGSGREVFGRLTESIGVWTLTYRVLISGVENSVNLSSSFPNAKVLVPRRFNLLTANEESFRGSAIFSGTTTALSSHITQLSDAHDASAISILDAAGHFAATDVEAALAATVGAGWVEGTSDSLKGHLSRATGAHAATAIAFTPLGTRTTPLTSTEVNDAIEDLHGEVEALQAAPPGMLLGFKYFLSSAGQTVFDVTGAPNAPFNVGNGSLLVFRSGTLQSLDAGHYTENETFLGSGVGMNITLSTPALINTNVILVWFK